MQPGKNIKIVLNYFLGPLLFLWLAWSIYSQVKAQPNLIHSWHAVLHSGQDGRIWFLMGVLLLLFVNWGIEARKWQLAASLIAPLSFMKAFKAVLSGVSISVSLPNRVGEYLGRMMYMPEGKRLKTVSVTLVGSLAQLICTFSMGLLALLGLKWRLINGLHVSTWAFQLGLYGTLLVLGIALLAYFHIDFVYGLVHRWFAHGRYDYLVEALREFDRQLLGRILMLSFMRYAVFIAQYLLIYRFFAITVPIPALMGVTALIFLAMAIIPSVSLLELGIRGQVSIALLGLFTSDLLGAGLASLTVWLINLIIPAVLGSLLILNMKIFRKRHEESHLHIASAESHDEAA